MSYVKRDQDHTDALILVEQAFERHGFASHCFGTEHRDSKDLREAIAGQIDDLALAWRFRPDVLQIRKGQRTLLCEVKSEGNDKPNFAIEFDAWKAGLWWDRRQSQVVLVGADLVRHRLQACWVTVPPAPRKVTVPMRWDYQESKARIQKAHPGVFIELRPYDGNGSGTPYFLLHKSAPFWQDLDRFIEQQVLQRAQPPTNGQLRLQAVRP